MKVVGNCPSCGNPIWADGPEVTKRTCFCVVPVRTQPITITPAPYVQPLTWPQYPYYWWSNANDPTSTIQTTFTTGNTTVIQPPKPPDEDAGLVT